MTHTIEVVGTASTVSWIKPAFYHTYFTVSNGFCLGLYLEGS